jgi:uncharacterized protein
MHPRSALSPIHPGRGRPVFRALLALLGSVLLLGGCGIAVDSGGGDTGSDSPIDSVNRDDLDSDERGAVDATTAFWRETFPADFRQSYRPPRVLGGYVGEDGPSCGGQPSVPFNAFYCPSQDFLAWDENLMAAGYERIGDAWVYLIISHEWGHAIQARLRRGQVSVAAELQADCLSGAALLGAVNDGDLRLEQGDEEEIAQTLAVVADDFPWTDSRSHGNAEQRTSAFEAGANNGPRACT